MRLCKPIDICEDCRFVPHLDRAHQPFFSLLELGFEDAGLNSDGLSDNHEPICDSVAVTGHRYRTLEPAGNAPRLQYVEHLVE